MKSAKKDFYYVFIYLGTVWKNSFLKACSEILFHQELVKGPVLGPSAAHSSQALNCLKPSRDLSPANAPTFSATDSAPLHQAKPWWCWQPPCSCTASHSYLCSPTSPESSYSHRRSRVKCWLALPGIGNIIITRSFRFLLTGTIPWAEGTSSNYAELLQWPGKGALAAGSPHVTPTRYDLGSGLMCVGPTSLWQASRILWFTGGDVWVFQKYAREERTDEGIWKRCTYGFFEG